MYCPDEPVVLQGELAMDMPSQYVRRPGTAEAIAGRKSL
ncbi:hypothetical protein NSND_50323 [Nitrospira sp. ND1]|nr:hypothetical protein NSND_50323 [Nitrospira sp. ND1]